MKRGNPRERQLRRERRAARIADQRQIRDAEGSPPKFNQKPHVMKTGDRVYKIYCGGQDLVTVIAVNKKTVRIQYDDSRKRTVDKRYVVPISKK